MKILKTMTAAALLMIGTVVMAQGPGNRQMRSASERAKMETERMVKSLDLNAEQTAKVQAINLAYAVKDSVSFAAMRNAMSAGNVDREAMKAAREVTAKAKTTEIKALLTDAQKAKYETYIKESLQRGLRPGGQGNRPGGGQPQGGQE